MAVVTYQLRQQTSVQDGPLYRVNNSITEAVGSSPAVFVYKTDTLAFDHYATVADLETWPDSYDQAIVLGAGFYRLSSVQRDWPTIQRMNEDLGLTVARVTGLAKQLSAVQGSVTIDRTVTITEGI